MELDCLVYYNVVTVVVRYTELYVYCNVVPDEDGVYQVVRKL